MSSERYHHGGGSRSRRVGRVVARGEGRDRGSTTSAFAVFLVVVAITAGMLGYALNKLTTSGDASSGVAATATATATADQLTGLTAEQVAIRLLDAGVPLQTTRVYDAASDPNQLLGQPGGYSSKIAFSDQRTGVNTLTVTSKDPVEQGGSIEVFPDQADATTRAEQLRAASESADPLSQEFIYQQGAVVLRVSIYLDESEAKAYETALTALATAATAATAATPSASTG